MKKNQKIEELDNFVTRLEGVYFDNKKRVIKLLLGQSKSTKEFFVSKLFNKENISSILDNYNIDDNIEYFGLKQNKDFSITCKKISKYSKSLKEYHAIISNIAFLIIHDDIKGFDKSIVKKCMKNYKVISSSMMYPVDTNTIIVYYNKGYIYIGKDFLEYIMTEVSNTLSNIGDNESNETLSDYIILNQLFLNDDIKCKVLLNSEDPLDYNLYYKYILNVSLIDNALTLLDRLDNINDINETESK